MVPRDVPLPAPTPVVVDGATIATWVLEPAQPAKGDVVLCHGTPWSAEVWREVAHELSRDHRVFLWDMPGYGRSTKDDAIAVDLRAQATRLTALLELWGLDRPHVFAHDIGGAVALRAHLLLGAEYSDLFLWDIVTLDPWGSPFFHLVAENVDVFTRLPPKLHAALVREYITGAARGRLTDDVLDVLIRPWADADGQPAFYRQIAALSPDDTRLVAERLDLTRCPTRIGWGAEDPWIPRRQAFELQSRLPGHPDVVELEDVGHLAPLENPTAVSAAVRAWLTEPRPPAP